MYTNIDVEAKIEMAIKAKKVTKKSVYEAIPMSQTGFLDMIRDKTTSVKTLLKISDILDMHPAEFFPGKTGDIHTGAIDMMTMEAYFNTINKELTDISYEDLIKENIFLRIQVDRLTKAIENFSNK